MKKIIVIGSGFSGSILARKIAEELGREVLIIEKRNHIGGNAYDEYDGNGILIQKYGPHYLNTNKYSIISFLKQYGELFPHNPKLMSFIDGEYIQLPFNFTSVQQLIGYEKSEKLIHDMRKAFIGRERVPVLELIDHCNSGIKEFGELLFDKAYKTYVSKQWGLSVEQIDKYVLDRVPMAMNYDERYLNKDYQFLPKLGFYKLFENMLSHDNIYIKKNTNALEHIIFDNEMNTIVYDGEEVEALIFTGPIDELFHFKYGALPYRSLDIRYEYSQKNAILPSEIISYPQATGYTRSTEYRKLMFDDSNVTGSVVATEYPLAYDKDGDIGNIPFYPVNTEESDKIYQQYKELASNYKNLFLCGRLAEFKYYNMDICIEHALTYFEDIKKTLGNK